MIMSSTQVKSTAKYSFKRMTGQKKLFQEVVLGTWFGTLGLNYRRCPLRSLRLLKSVCGF